jgi:hypothetical protein
MRAVLSQVSILRPGAPGRNIALPSRLAKPRYCLHVVLLNALTVAKLRQGLLVRWQALDRQPCGTTLPPDHRPAGHLHPWRKRARQAFATRRRQHLPWQAEPGQYLWVEFETGFGAGQEPVR